MWDNLLNLNPVELQENISPLRLRVVALPDGIREPSKLPVEGTLGSSLVALGLRQRMPSRRNREDSIRVRTWRQAFSCENGAPDTTFTPFRASGYKPISTSQQSIELGEGTSNRARAAAVRFSGPAFSVWGSCFYAFSENSTFGACPKPQTLYDTQTLNLKPFLTPFF